MRTGFSVPAMEVNHDRLVQLLDRGGDQLVVAGGDGLRRCARMGDGAGIRRLLAQRDR